MSRRVTLPMAVFGMVAIVAFGALFWQSRVITMRLGEPAVLTGYTLFAAMLLLGVFNARKKLSMIPIGRGSTWLAFHVIMGIFAIALFWLHLGTLWPQGFYEQLLAGSFYLVSLSGIVGYLLQKVLPHRLTQTRVEIIYERIPAEIAEIRERAEALALECTEKSGSDTVAQHFIGTLSWYFLQPRFQLSHFIGGDAARYWLRGPGSAAGRYLNDIEKEYFDQIMSLAELKSYVDRHFVCQGVMKKWLFLHIPLALAVVALSLWHLILVNVYVL